MATAATADVLDLPPRTVLEEERDLVGGYATAVFDNTEPAVYRYLLTRVWNPDRPTACWVMLNPSTATARDADATLRRVVDFTDRFGCGALAIVNLFALRSRHPGRLLDHGEPVGEHNDRFIRQAARHAHTTGGPVITAWGSWANNPRLKPRATTVTGLLNATGAPLQCLGTTSETSGHQPLHPLMLAGATTLRPHTPGEPA